MHAVCLVSQGFCLVRARFLFSSGEKGLLDLAVSHLRSECGNLEIYCRVQYLVLDRWAGKLGFDQWSREAIADSKLK